MVPELVHGDFTVDDRGYLYYATDVDFTAVRRVYTVSNHNVGTIRAWHGHQEETKIVLVVSGTAIIAAVQIDDWNNPSRTLPIYRWVLSEHKPTILRIPPGYANGSKTLSPYTRILYLSTATLEQSLADDYRWPLDYWNPWSMNTRNIQKPSLTAAPRIPLPSALANTRNPPRTSR